MSHPGRISTALDRRGDMCVCSTGRGWVRLAGLLTGLLAVLAGWPVSAETVVIEEGSPMIYLANTSDPGVDASWFLPGFVEGPEWMAGTYGVGHEFIAFPPDAHDLISTPVPAQSASIYTRTTFNVVNAASVFSLHFSGDYDDGLVAWINGVEVYRSPELRGQTLVWDTIALNHESSNGTEPDYSPMRDVSAAGLGALGNGENVLAVGVWNATILSEDLVLVPRLVVNRMLTRRPYLQQGTANSIIVRWGTGDTADSRVLYGSSPGNLSNEVTVPGPATDHTVTLTGLEPNTRYYYAVATATEILAGGDAGHFFDTPSSTGTPKPMRIWILGDAGWGNGAAVDVRDAYYDYTDDVANGGADPRDTDLVLLLGDNAYPDGTQLDHQYNLFDIFSDQLAKSVVWPTIGNHDEFDGVEGNWPYYDIFTLPEQAEAGGIASGTEEYYSFDYGNVHFIVLNSMEPILPGFGAAMLAWLEVDLFLATEEWIVTIFHHPPYSKGGHDSDDPADSGGRLVWMRENALPKLEDYGVDLVLTGHSHSYERSYLIDGHYGDSTTFLESMKIDAGDGNETGGDGPYVKQPRGAVPYPGVGDGAVYAVSGSASQTTTGAAVDLGGTDPNHPAMVISLLSLGSMVLDVNGNRMDARFLDDTGVILDEFTIFKGAPTVVPVAEFTASPRLGQLPTTVDFTDLTLSGPTVWSWDFDNDGIAESSLIDPSHEFTEPGLHSVKLSVANSAGSDEELKTEYICITSGSPGPVTGLRFDTDPDVFFWDPALNATGDDAVRGNLTALVAGDLGSLQLTCIENDDADLQASDGTPPASGEVLFYLSGAATCAGEQGTYNSPGSVDRDGSLQPVCASCPNGEDDDADGVCLSEDNCPEVPNPAQLDGDMDGFGDACDGCPADPDKSVPGLCGCGVAETDTDSDGTPDCLDLCPTDTNKTAPGVCGCGEADIDTDNDGTLDCLDLCPTDPDKTAPGLCGCGVADTDTDTDGTPDCNDLCPTDPAKIDPGLCGCGIADTDTDSDGTPDCNDLCPTDPNKIDPGLCGCGVADTDTDSDGTPDCNDLCPTDPNKTDPGLCGCGVADTDTDSDGTPDCNDLCPTDPFKIVPGLCGCGVTDSDTDGDGTPNCLDDCPDDPNKTAKGICGCGVPDTDSDTDGTVDCLDGCPSDPDKITPGLCGCFVDECWAPVPTGTTRILEAVDFPVDTLVGYVVGEAGTILKTANGGLSWSPQVSTTIVDLEAVHFPADDQTGFVVGDFGIILRTTDGGANWIPMVTGTTTNLRGVHIFPNKDIGFAVGDGGMILKTANGGANWLMQTSPTTAILESIQFPENGQTGYVVGRAGTVLKTDNGGFTWFAQISPTLDDLEDLHFPADSQTGYIVGDNGTLMKTVTGGFSWIALNAHTSKTLRAVHFPLDTVKGRVVGNDGVIRKTENAGVDWVSDGAVTPLTLRDVQFPVDHQTGFAVGSSGVFLKWVTE
jgi:photosystem II stability/assembly factor-like uncharacterized protein